MARVLAYLVVGCSIIALVDWLALNAAVERIKAAL